MIALTLALIALAVPVAIASNGPLVYFVVIK